jgi:hypothetical protein
MRVVHWRRESKKERERQRERQRQREKSKLFGRMRKQKVIGLVSTQIKLIKLLYCC